jgi:hypothetical protein
MFGIIFIAASEAWYDITETIIGLNKPLSGIRRNLELFSAVYTARFIVWRELRRRRKQERTVTDSSKDCC